MRATLILAMLSTLYKTHLRAILVDQVADPESDWDDILLAVCDALFGYSKESL